MLAKVLLVAALATVAFTSTAAAATPRAATKRIASCLKDDAGFNALKVQTRGSDDEWNRAYLARPFHAGSTRYLAWYLLTTEDRVVGTVTYWVGLTKRERRLANRCLKPFNGHT